MRRSYTVSDQDDRTWGTFDVIGETEGKIYGYLKPMPDFKDIHPVFLAHEKALASPDADTDLTIRNIVALGAYLVDNSSGKRIDIDRMIFISDKLLVTCEPVRRG